MVVRVRKSRDDVYTISMTVKSDLGNEGHYEVGGAELVVAIVRLRRVT
jgi:hypothetical protein